MSGERSSTVDPSPKNQLKRKQILTALTAFFLFLAVIFFLYWLFIGRFYETTDDAYVNGNLVQVMSPIPGQVTAILADETNLVRKGAPIILLNKVDAEIALKTAESQLALTARQVSQYYQNVGQLQAKLQQQKEALQKAEDDYKRRVKLVVGKVISSEELEHAKLEMNEAESALNLDQHQLNGAIALVANSDLYHHPQIQRMAVKVRNAYLTLKRTTIYAPETGYVAKRSVQVGQQISPNTVLMIIVPLNQVWVDANFKESQLSHFRIGQAVNLVSDIYGSSVTFHGKVMGLNPGAGNSFALLPPQNATGNWIKIVQRLPVRIIIDPEQLKEHPLRLGLSMTVTVNTHDRKGVTLEKFSQGKVIYQSRDYSADYLKEADKLITGILEQNAKNVSYPAVN